MLNATVGINGLKLKCNVVIVVEPITDDISSMECSLAENFYLQTKHCTFRSLQGSLLFTEKQESDE